MMIFFDKETQQFVLTLEKDNVTITLTKEQVKDLQNEIDYALMKMDSNFRPKYLNGIF